MKKIVIIKVTIFVFTLMVYSQQSYHLERGTIISAGNIAKSSSYIVVNRFGMPHPGTMGNSAFIVGPHTGVEEIHDKEKLPLTYAFEQNYPNPFNSSTTFAYSLPEPSDVFITVFSVMGQKLVTLESRHRPAGHYTLTYKGLDIARKPLPSGLYLCSMRANRFEKTVKFIIVR